MRDLRWFALQTMLFMWLWKDSLESMVMPKSMECSTMLMEILSMWNVLFVWWGPMGRILHIAFGMRYFELPGGGP